MKAQVYTIHALVAYLKGFHNGFQTGVLVKGSTTGSKMGYRRV